MNRSITVIGVAAVAIATFAAAAYFYNRDQQNQPIDDKAALVRPYSPVIGPANARVTIVEFFDPSCEACRAFHPAVKQILGLFPNDVRLVLRYTPFHKGSDEAVRILETARTQNVFAPVLDALYEAQPEWADHSGPKLDKAWEAAGKAGLDVTKAQAGKLAPRITTTMDQDVADGKAVGIRGTPTFFVNGKPLTRLGPQQLYDMVLFEVRATK